MADPRTGEIRYVGKSKNINSRLGDHCSPCNLRKRTKKNNWIKSLKKEGLKPLLEIIEQVDNDTVNESEKYWISQLKSWNFNLTNGTDGGDGGATITGRSLSQLTRDKIGRSNTGKIRDIETRNKISVSVSKSLLGNKRAVGSKGWVGKKHKEATKEKCRDNHPNTKRILMCNLDGTLIKTFNSLREASRETGIERSSISRCCDPRHPSYKTRGGYIWKYE